MYFLLHSCAEFRQFVNHEWALGLIKLQGIVSVCPCGGDRLRRQNHLHAFLASSLSPEVQRTDLFGEAAGLPMLARLGAFSAQLLLTSPSPACGPPSPSVLTSRPLCGLRLAGGWGSEALRGGRLAPCSWLAKPCLPRLPKQLLQAPSVTQREKARAVLRPEDASGPVTCWLGAFLPRPASLGRSPTPGLSSRIAGRFASVWLFLLGTGLPGIGPSDFGLLTFTLHFCQFFRGSGQATSCTGLLFPVGKLSCQLVVELMDGNMHGFTKVILSA